MSKLKELEKRLRDEPANLGLRVMVAGALREAGRQGEAVELYRSVAIAYRDQGRSQQAIAVCRSILEIAPDDARCHALLGMLVATHKGRAAQDTAQPYGNDIVLEVGTPPPPARPTLPQAPRRPAPLTPTPVSLRPPPKVPPKAPPEPKRRSSLDETPLPRPMPYHLADPTTKNLEKLSGTELSVTDPLDDLPISEGAATRPGSDPGELPEIGGIASAARKISASLIASGHHEEEDLALELDTRQRPRIESTELAKISRPPPTLPLELVTDDEDALTPPPVHGVPARGSAAGEDEDTRPRDLPDLSPRRSRPVTKGPLGNAFFAPLPLERRGAVLTRFQRRSVTAGETVIRQGETAHALIIVTRGQLQLRVERSDGKLVAVGAIEVGDYVGEASLLARKPAPAHVIATLDSDLLLLPPRDFYEITGAFPALWSVLKDTAERRTRELEARLRR